MCLIQTGTIKGKHENMKHWLIFINVIILRVRNIIFGTRYIWMYIVLIAILSVVCSNSIAKQPFPNTIVSPLNGNKLSPEKTGNTYSFLFAGHTYGSPNGGKASLYPAASLLANLDRINYLDPAFFIFVGDIVFQSDSARIKNFLKSVTDKMPFPVFNAIGNHDVDPDRLLFEQYFGKTYYHFSLGSELYLVLDSELHIPGINGEQLDFLLKHLSETGNGIKNIFVFAHRRIWFRSAMHYDDVKDDPFHTAITPVLKEAAKSKSIYWIAGDWRFPLLYVQDSETGVHYLSTALNDAENDMMIHVQIDNGNVELKPLSLTGKKTMQLEQYNPSHYNLHFGGMAPQEPELITRTKSVINEKIWSMITHKYFWIGLLLGTFIALIIVQLKRWCKD